MKVDEILNVLRSQGFAITSVEDAKDGINKVIKVRDCTITTYSNGNHQVQGPNGITKQHLQGLLPNVSQSKASATAAMTTRSVPPKKRVFLVHGHDENNLLRLQKCLYADGYEPIVLKDLPHLGMTGSLLEKLERIFAEGIDCAVILYTPCDKYEFASGHVSRVRPNVDLELGWCMAKLSRDKVILLKKECAEGAFDMPSDISGATRHQFRDNIETILHDILNEVRSATNP